MHVPLGVSRPARRLDDGAAAPVAGLYRRGRAAATDAIRRRARKSRRSSKWTCRALPRSRARRPKRSALKLTRSNRTQRGLLRHRGGPVSSAPACRPSSAGRARSTRRISQTNSSTSRKSRPASASCTGWPRNWRTKRAAPTTREMCRVDGLSNPRRSKRLRYQSHQIMRFGRRPVEFSRKYKDLALFARQMKSLPIGVLLRTI